jgi:hypothetical protein
MKRGQWVSLKSPMPPHVNFIMDLKLVPIDHFLFGENATLQSQIDLLPYMTILFRQKRTKNERLTAGNDIR